ncbi:hypothetical protein [Rhodophyticola porphyridii]|uniref:Desulfoferrodoxin ferrous iron-binding domain-containing protein n=1 Tax=Rhodophyticola porphyridii TaxID=1852017 RepID=A0A3L9YCR2_9RHOB|nr:hypothetical protein [Rhodophyticola porphyridii]RMA43963.1 hypothetical protein D9R08_03345 [Rhodophyticola porphyridii]
MRHALAAICILLPLAALAEPPEIVVATYSDGRVSVTLAHPDTGWDHYADGWQVELEDGTVLGTRVLLHPHVEEQPFTRSLGDVAIPEGVTQVFIRARCNVTGWGEDRFALSVE